MTGSSTSSPARKMGAVSSVVARSSCDPKITDINRLLFMLGYARNPQIWRDDPIRVEPADELLPAVAEVFARIASRAVEQGLLQGYRTVTEALPVLRGRMLAGEQMSRRFGFPVPIAVEYDDFTVDIAENQLLAMATLRLLTVPRISTSARQRTATAASHVDGGLGAAARYTASAVAAEPSQHPLPGRIAAGRDRPLGRILRAFPRRPDGHRATCSICGRSSRTS